MVEKTPPNKLVPTKEFNRIYLEPKVHSFVSKMVKSGFTTSDSERLNDLSNRIGKLSQKIGSSIQDLAMVIAAIALTQASLFVADYSIKLGKALIKKHAIPTKDKK